MTKPLMLRTGGLSGRIWGIRRYSERPNGTVVSQQKEDVTDQAIDAVIEHIRFGCASLGCRCRMLSQVEAP